MGEININENINLLLLTKYIYNNIIQYVLILYTSTMTVLVYRINLREKVL